CGERGRLDRSRRRLADELAALALARQTVSGICRTRLFGETPNRATETVALRFLKFFRCSVPLLSSVFRPYVERSQTVPVSLDRAEVAESLGRTANLSSVESG